MIYFIRVTILFFSIVSAATSAAIDDSSFSNDGRYALLKDYHVKNGKLIDLQIQFVPPSGKKVNTASFVKIWEKKATEWFLVKKISADDEDFNVVTNSLKTKISLDKTDTFSAIEIEFIYCNKNGGGQCDMERYLARIVRNTQSKSTVLRLKLEI